MSRRDSRPSTAGPYRPVHVEIRPRDNYQHHVYVESPGEVLSWNFFTRRKNIAFGLFYLHCHAPSRKDSPLPPLKLLSHSGSNSSLPLANNSSKSGECGGGGGGGFYLQNDSRHSLSDSLSLRDLIQNSRGTVNIDPPARPRPGFSSASVPGSRTNSIVPPPLPADAGDRARTITEGRSLNDSMILAMDSNEGGLKNSHNNNNNSTPDLRASTVPSVMSAHSTTEYLEILPIERYESFEQTIVGSYTAPVAGTYVLYFDNSFSVNTPKELFLSVNVGGAGMVPDDGNFCGWLLKKKQRRMQGWARRWFQLSPRGILSYFEDRFNPCRGSIDLNECTITKVPHRQLITVDSGSQTFHLRALTPEDYERWSHKFNQIRMQHHAMETAQTLPPSQSLLLDYTARIAQGLSSGEQVISNLRELAMREDDGQIKYVGHLEQAFQSLQKLFGTLSEYASFLQRTGRRMSATLLQPTAPFDEATASAEEEFFDVEEIILSDVTESESEEEELQSTLAEMSVAPSEEDMRAALLLEKQQQQQLGLVPSSSPAEAKIVYRTLLPVPAPPCNISLSSILRKSIGKNWSATAMPVSINEPLSVLQRMCEDLEYHELLERAAAIPDDPVARLMLVCAFAVSPYALTAHRVERKPFTPILGETFEYEQAEGRFRFLAEKVSHRPLVIACHAQGTSGWSFWQHQTMNDKFWGKSIEYIPTGSLHLLFADTGDHFVWNRVVTCVRNLLSSNKWVENYGDLVVRNERTGDQAKITFKPSGSGLFFSSSNNAATANEVVGIVQSGRCPPTVLRGRWDSILCREYVEDGRQQLEVLWKAFPPPLEAAKFFNFSPFATTLNDLPQGLAELLPPTDSRLRPDQRMLEQGLVDEADQEKLRVEQMQREARQAMEAAQEKWAPRWFVASDGGWRIPFQHIGILSLEFHVDKLSRPLL